MAVNEAAALAVEVPVVEPVIKPFAATVPTTSIAAVLLNVKIPDAES
jgi:hypothetical protein